MVYMGSKNNIAKYICPIIQKYIDDNDIQYFYDPFVGGANIIDKIKCKNKIGSDLNSYLIALLERVRFGAPLLEVVTKDMYDDARKAWQGKSHMWDWADWEIGNIGWLSSFNGRGFDGGYRSIYEEKRKDGSVKIRNFYEECKNNLLK